MSGEENVWSCIVFYNNDSAEEISAQYKHNKSLILNRLNSYSGKSKYHGHISGGAGDGEHGGAADARAAAITHLKSYTPPQQAAQIVKVADNAKKSSNMKAESELSEIIRQHNGTTPALEALLTEKNPNWPHIRNVKSSFDSWKLQRKAKFGTPKKK